MADLYVSVIQMRLPAEIFQSKGDCDLYICNHMVTTSKYRHKSNYLCCVCIDWVHDSALDKQ